MKDIMFGIVLKHRSFPFVEDPHFSGGNACPGFSGEKEDGADVEYIMFGTEPKYRTFPFVEDPDFSGGNACPGFSGEKEEGASAYNFSPKTSGMFIFTSVVKPGNRCRA